MLYSNIQEVYGVSFGETQHSESVNTQHDKGDKSYSNFTLGNSDRQHLSEYTDTITSFTGSGTTGSLVPTSNVSNASNIHDKINGVQCEQLIEHMISCNHCTNKVRNKKQRTIFEHYFHNKNDTMMFVILLFLLYTIVYPKK